MKIIPHIKCNFKLIILSALGGFIGGFFGSGGGIAFVYILKKYFGNKKTIFPTTILVTLFSSALNSTVYFHTPPSSDYSLWGYLGGVFGAIAGCLLFDRLDIGLLKTLFLTLIIISGVIIIVF